MRITTQNIFTGERHTITIGRHRTHEFWAVTGPYRDGTYGIQRAGREGLGTSYDPPLPDHRGFPTKKAALAYKREHLRR